MVTSAVNAMVLYALEKMFLRSTGTVVLVFYRLKKSVTGMSDRRQSTFFSSSTTGRHNFGSHTRIPNSSFSLILKVIGNRTQGP